jgi:hypothetical protein
MVGLASSIDVRVSVPSDAMNADSSPEPRGRLAATARCGFLPLKQTTVLPRRSIAAGGPVPVLVGSGRWALPVWMLLVAAANPTRAIVDLHYYRNFGTRCLGMDGKHPSTLRSIVARTLSRLAQLRLITVHEKRYGQVIVQLRALDGSGDPYTMPHRKTTKVTHVPTGPLFGNGWHLELTHVELAALLIALTEESWQHNKFGPHQWEKPRDAIARDYGIAASTWSKGKQGLFTHGLLDWDLPQLDTGSRPERVPVDRYTVDISALALTPKDAPRFTALSVGQTITAPGTGDPLLFHRHIRVPLQLGSGDPTSPPNVVHLRRPGRRRNAYTS